MTENSLDRVNLVEIALKFVDPRQEFTRSDENHGASLARNKKKISPKLKETNEALKRLGAFIRTRRKNQGLSQTSIGDLAGVGLNFVSQIEAGKSTAQIGKILKVLNTLGLQVALEEGSETVVIPQDEQ